MQPPAPPPAPAAPPPDAVASPVQNPLAAPRDGPEPVAYVSLVPGAAASRDGYFAVATAYMCASYVPAVNKRYTVTFLV